MKLSLYQITEEYLQIAEALKEGEATPELETALALNEHNLQVKSVNYAYLVKDMQAENTAIDNEIERLTKLKAQRDNAITRLEDTVKAAMILYGIEKIESNNIKISFRKSTQVIIDDEESIPAKYKKKKVTLSVDKAGLNNDLNTGKKIKGARLQENKNIQIK